MRLSRTYLNLFVQIALSLRQSSVETYESWLRPFVNWLEEELQKKNQPVSSLVIKRYLQDVRKFKSKTTYMRRGSQICKFVNREQEEFVKVIEPVGYALKDDNVNLPDEWEEPLNKWLKARLRKLCATTPVLELSQELSKIFGKYQYCFAHLTFG